MTAKGNEVAGRVLARVRQAEALRWYSQVSEAGRPRVTFNADTHAVLKACLRPDSEAVIDRLALVAGVAVCDELSTGRCFTALTRKQLAKIARPLRRLDVLIRGTKGATRDVLVALFPKIGHANAEEAFLHWQGRLHVLSATTGIMAAEVSKTKRREAYPTRLARNVVSVLQDAGYALRDSETGIAQTIVGAILHETLGHDNMDVREVVRRVLRSGASKR
jgi:hypothetical protein